jgi:dCMP deaminase
MERPDWNEFFMEVAKSISTRATCPRASVGAVVVKDKRIISTGYDDAPAHLEVEAGEWHCTEAGCDIVNNHCTRAIHAEVNAICQAAKFGISVKDSTVFIYGLERPEACHNCLQVMKAAGVRFIAEKIKGSIVHTGL